MDPLWTRYGEWTRYGPAFWTRYHGDPLLLGSGPSGGPENYPLGPDPPPSILGEVWGRVQTHPLASWVTWV